MKLWSVTNIGAVRKENQDSLQTAWLDDETALAVVCDGMGGARGGRVASQMAVSRFVESLQSAGPGVDWPGAMDGAAQLANTEIYERSLQDPACDGMGTTLVAALVTPDTMYILNVGDSRCYQIQSGQIAQITRDHSLVENLLELGEITPEEARVHPQKNLITRALGVDPTVKADIFELRNQGGCLLLCSDGLSNQLTDRELCREVSAPNRESCCQRLLQLALERGAPDNVSAIVLQL